MVKVLIGLTSYINIHCFAVLFFFLICLINDRYQRLRVLSSNRREIHRRDITKAEPELCWKPKINIHQLRGLIVFTKKQLV